MYEVLFMFNLLIDPHLPSAVEKNGMIKELHIRLIWLQYEEAQHTYCRFRQLVAVIAQSFASSFFIEKYISKSQNNCIYW